MNNKDREFENLNETAENTEEIKASKGKKKKKIMYVPDEDVLAYGRSLGADQGTDDTAVPTANDTDTVKAEESVVAEDDTDITPEIKSEDKTEVSEDNDEVTEAQASDTDDGTVKAKKKNIFIRILSAVFPTKKDSRKRVILKCVSIVAALAILASGGYLVYYFTDLGTQNQVINYQRAIYDLNRYDYVTETAEGYLAKFSELKRQNNDLIGWLSISGTEVDNPVYQRDNEFYLNHDMNGKSNSYGSLFLDERCDVYPSRRTQNQIIYGHNMRYGAMFGTLDEYRNIDYYKQHPVITFDSLWEHNEYKIFAVMITNDSTDDTFGYNFSAYRNEFVNQEDFLLWTEYCKQRSLFDTTVDILPDDEVITLSTCCYDFDEARLIIVGRLVREGESSDVDVENAAVNSDVIYSKEYYEKKKLPIPQVETPTVNVYDR